MRQLVSLEAARDPEYLAHLLSPERALEPLLWAAHQVRLEGHGQRISYSPKAFLPLTQLCRDNCGYCTFAKPPRPGARAFMSEDEILGLARAAVQAGCTEALFTLGDKPERRYRVARDELRAMGFETTVQYLVHIAGRVLEETGLIPHANPGVLTHDEMALLHRQRQPGPDAGAGHAPAVAERRVALGQPRQAAGSTPEDHRAGW